MITRVTRDGYLFIPPVTGQMSRLQQAGAPSPATEARDPTALSLIPARLWCMILCMIAAAGGACCGYARGVADERLNAGVAELTLFGVMVRVISTGLFFSGSHTGEKA